MKLEKYFLLLALGVFAFALQSCDDDDNDGISVPAELSNALAKEHPNAQRMFFSDKYDITKHPNYKYLSDYDKKNTFDMEKGISAQKSASLQSTPLYFSKA